MIEFPKEIAVRAWEWSMNCCREVAVSSQQVVNRDKNLRRESSCINPGVRSASWRADLSVRKSPKFRVGCTIKVDRHGLTFVQSVATSSIKRDTRNLIFTLCLRIIKSGYRNINAVILSVIGKVLPQQPLCSAPLFILIWLSCNASKGPCIAIGKRKATWRVNGASPFGK